MLFNATSGRTSQGHTSRSRLWRTASFTAIAIGAGVLFTPDEVRAQSIDPPDSPCVISGSTATCSGDLSAGVEASFPLTTLNVENLDRPIEPAFNSSGVDILSNSSGARINADLGTFGIIADGDNSFGIRARGGRPGDVEVRSTGNITTFGEESFGILVENRGDGDAILNSTGEISARGSRSLGIEVTESGDGDLFVHSIGDISIRSFLSAGIAVRERDDGSAEVRSTGDITTRDNGSLGISANEDGSGDMRVHSTGNISTRGNGSSGISVREDGAGHAIVVSKGGVSPDGRNAHGLIVEEDAAGNAVVSSTGVIDARGDGATGIRVEEGGGGGIEIESIGNISTAGLNADGIFAQESRGGAIHITSVGDINARFRDAASTLADQETSAGIRALSPDGGDIAISATGDVAAEGDGAAGIVAEASGNGAIDIDIGAGGVAGAAGVIAEVENGPVTIGLGPGARVFGDDTGIEIVGDGIGRVNLAPGARLGSSGVAVRAGDGDETISNSGLVVGDLALGGGSNLFDNLARGRFFPAGSVDLGASGRLLNAGVVEPRGSGTIGVTQVNGDFVQSKSGSLAIDRNTTGAGTNDLLAIEGEATLAGAVNVRLVGPLTLEPFTILTATEGATDNGVVDGNLIGGSPAGTVKVDFASPTEVTARIAVNDTDESLNAAQASVFGALQDVTSNDDPRAPIVEAILGLDSIDEAKAAADQLGAEVVTGEGLAAVAASAAFADAMFSCETLGGAPYAAITERTCVWIRSEGRFVDRDRTAKNIGFDEKAAGLSLGGQVVLSEGFSLGLALGYEAAALDADTGAESDSDRFSAGVVAKHQQGPFTMAGAVFAGYADVATRRPMAFGGFQAIATADSSAVFYGAEARAAYLLEDGRMYAKPQLDLNVTVTERSDAVEAGAGSANLIIDGGTDTSISATPALEIGIDGQLAAIGPARAYAQGGVAVYADDERNVSARFAVAPAGAGAFETSVPTDRAVGEFEAGLQLFPDPLATIQLAYRGRYSGTTTQHGGFVKFALNF